MTALREVDQVGNLQPTTLVSYDADIVVCSIAGMSTPSKAQDIDAAALADCTWRDQMKASGEARTQAFARRLMGKGFRALLVRSFAPGATESDLNLVLWDWGASPPSRLTLIDAMLGCLGAQYALGAARSARQPCTSRWWSALRRSRTLKRWCRSHRRLDPKKDADLAGVHRLQLAALGSASSTVLHVRDPRKGGTESRTSSPRSSATRAAGLDAEGAENLGENERLGAGTLSSGPAVLPQIQVVTLWVLTVKSIGDEGVEPIRRRFSCPGSTRRRSIVARVPSATTDRKEIVSRFRARLLRRP